MPKRGLRSVETESLADVEQGQDLESVAASRAVPTGVAAASTDPPRLPLPSSFSFAAFRPSTLTFWNSRPAFAHLPMCGGCRSNYTTDSGRRACALGVVLGLGLVFVVVVVVVDVVAVAVVVVGRCQRRVPSCAAHTPPLPG